MESASNGAITQTVPASKLKNALGVARTLLIGLWFSTVFGQILLAKRMPKSHWHLILALIVMIVATIGLFRKDESKGTGQMIWLAFCLFLTPVYYMRTHDWAPVATGVLLAAFFWVISKTTGRTYPFILLGSLLSGVLSLHFPWPNGQRCLLTFVFTGFAVSLQGIWIILRYLQGDRSVLPVAPIGTSDKSSGRESLRFVHLIFGTVEHVQISSPDLEQKFRTRYQSEISQLTYLGFYYQFSDGQTISLFRLPLILPAFFIIAMWLKRRPISMHEGTKLMVAYPILFSESKTAYAEIGDFGVSFHSAFRDGTILISKNYDDKNIPAGPLIVKYAKKTTISDTWASHQARIASMEAEGKRVDRLYNFQAYAEISHKETAAW